MTLCKFKADCLTIVTMLIVLITDIKMLIIVNSKFCVNGNLSVMVKNMNGNS